MTGPAPTPGERSSVALALVNTLLVGSSGELDLLSGPSVMRAWLDDHAVRSPVRVRRVDVERLGRLRAGVLDVFAARTENRTADPSSVRLINAAAAGAPGAAQLRWTDTGPVRTWHGGRPASADAALAVIATDAIDVVTGPRGTLLRRCEAHGCVRWFLREHARRRWCCTTCGDRVRAARHYQRRPAGD